jgi:hypothetical protein
MDHEELLYARLLQGYAAMPARAPLEERWTWLEAAHVAGQMRLRLHWDSHVRMLGLAWGSRDFPEVAGQLLRLALVPVGHAIGRLPAGNIGRATVNAFRPMEPPAEVQRLITGAQQAAHPTPGGGSS